MTLSREQFEAKFRGRLLLLLAEAWAVRKAVPSDLGLLIDAHAVECKRLLGDMWDAMYQAPKANGLQTPAPPSKAQEKR